MINPIVYSHFWQFLYLGENYVEWKVCSLNQMLCALPFRVSFILFIIYVISLHFLGEDALSKVTVKPYIFTKKKYLK